jgi:hypothetical protein
MSLRSWWLGASLLAFALPFLAQAPAKSDVVVLNTWRVHAGDSLSWAAPGFDDSQWQLTDAPVRENIISAYSGFRWYRTTVALPATLQGRDLAIGFGPLDEVFEVYVEGVSVGRFGHWMPRPESPFDRNLTFAVPAKLIPVPAVHIAIRRWTGPSATSLFPYYTSGAARFPHPPELGLLSTVNARNRLYTFTGIVRNFPWNLCLFLMLASGCVALVLFSVQRSRIEYLLLGFFCVGSFLDPLIGGLLASNQSVMRRSWAPMLVYAAYSLVNCSSILFLSRLCLRFRHWLEMGAILCLLLGWTAVYVIAAQATYTNSSFVGILADVPVLFLLLGAYGLLLEQEAGSVAIAIALVVRQVGDAWVNHFSNLFGVSDLRFMPLGPMVVDIRAVTEVIFVFVTLIVLCLRYRDEQFRQVALEQDIGSARRMQEQLLGGNPLSLPGYSIEAVYRPAAEVGGDFYRTLPLADGSLLVVVGDVSGKGLDAAMLVAAVLGSLANEVERAPASLLAYLNQAVMGRTGGGFITACCAHFKPGGSMVIANAGHISPYLDGRELALENGLPLGVSADAHYTETTIQTGGTVTFLSDGVVEARNAMGELLGFERTTALTRKPAAEIADAAQRWGQQDDITVLTVAWMPNASIA